MADEEQNSIDEKRQAELGQRADDFRATFTKYEPGIRVYKYLEELCLKHSQTFVIGSEEMSDFNCGAREIILRIDDEINKVNKEPKQETAEN